MKKYAAPKMDINVFNDETVVTNSTIKPGADGYVAGLESIENKQQIARENMVEITKFIF